jgi:hypothetical protein
MRPLIALAVVAFSLPAHAGPKPETSTARATVAEMKNRPPSERKHDRWWYDRAAERCERRATEWARERCLREIAK